MAARTKDDLAAPTRHGKCAPGAGACNLGAAGGQGRHQRVSPCENTYLWSQTPQPIDETIATNARRRMRTCACGHIPLRQKIMRFTTRRMLDMLCGL